MPTDLSSLPLPPQPATSDSELQACLRRVQELWLALDRLTVEPRRGPAPDSAPADAMVGGSYPD
ncbi:MAG: hypothetical protein WBG17_11480 [Burkholderiaceae bacterium]